MSDKIDDELRNNVNSYIGTTVGNWTILGLCSKTDKYRNTLYRCRCNLCGNVKVRIARFITDPTSEHHPFSCGCISVGVAVIKKCLRAWGVKYVEEATYNDLLSPKGSKLRFDFLIRIPNPLNPNNLIDYAAIEYDGIQHTDLQAFRRLNKCRTIKEAKEKMLYYNECDRMKEIFCLNCGLHFKRINYTRNPNEIVDELVKYMKSIGFCFEDSKSII